MTVLHFVKKKVISFWQTKQVVIKSQVINASGYTEKLFNSISKQTNWLTFNKVKI